MGYVSNYLNGVIIWSWDSQFIVKISNEKFHVNYVTFEKRKIFTF